MKTGRTITEFVSIVEPYIDEFAAEVEQRFGELAGKMSKMGEEQDFTAEEIEIFDVMFTEKVKKIFEES